MNDHQDRESIGEGMPPVDGVSALLRLSKADAQPEARAERVRGTVHAAWRASVARRSRVRRMRWLGWAAAAMLAIVVAWMWMPDGRETGAGVVQIASVTSVSGTVRLPSTREQPTVRLLDRGATITAGAVIDTGRGRAALSLAGGTTIRLDAGTRLRLTSAENLRLERGAVYAVADGAPLEIWTPLGTARDIGTRFEVRVNDDTLRVRVRDGLVDIENANRNHRAEAGTEVRLEEGRVERTLLPTHGSAWDWTVTIAPAFALDGATLASFLAWLERESGWDVAWASDDLARGAPEIDLFGPAIEHMSPDQALGAVMAITGLEAQRDGNLVTVSAPEGGKTADWRPRRSS